NLSAKLKKAADVSPHMRTRSTGWHDSERGAIAEPAIHTRNAILSRAEKTFHRLQRHKGKQPILDGCLSHHLLLQVVVLRGDQHIKRVGGASYMLELIFG